MLRFIYIIIGLVCVIFSPIVSVELNEEKQIPASNNEPFEATPFENNEKKPNPLSFGGALDVTYNIVSNTFDYIGSYIGISETCPYVSDIMVSIKNNLPMHIKAQKEGIEFIVNAVSSWEFQKRSGLSEPLILAFTGSTGVGKTETAFRVADIILAKKTRINTSKKYLPNGLLVLRGEDYTSVSGLTVGEIHTDVRNKITNHLMLCHGNAVVIFDEIQKVLPGTLDILVSAIGEQGYISTTDNTNQNNTSIKYNKVYSTSNVVFIFISDIGADRMIKLLLAYGEKDLIPKAKLRSEVKSALDDQWNRLQFGKLIKEVIPFLPLEPQDISEIFLLKLKQMKEDHKYNYWMDLTVDLELVNILTSSKYIKYSNHTVKVPANTIGETLISNNGEMNDAIPNHVRSKVFATWGARALENAGPLQDLRSIIFRYMQPWRATEVLHVGITNSSTSEAQKKYWGISTKSESNFDVNNSIIYLQWCRVNEKLFKNRKNEWFQIDSIVAFSNQCETIWFGSLDKI